jgi:hypothetical protein
MKSQATDGPGAGNMEEAIRLTSKLKSIVEANESLIPQKKEDALACLRKMEEGLHTGTSPDKLQFDDLMKAIGEEEEITTPALLLGEKCGYLPSL